MSTKSRSCERTWQAGVIDLIQTDTPRTRIAVYQRLLYASRWSDFLKTIQKNDDLEIPSSMATFLSTIDFERLAVEQKARMRNLNSHFARSCPSLYLVLSKETRQRLLEEFINYDLMWATRGRTLAENFCLFVYEELADPTNGFAREVARLSGMRSGLSYAPNTASPWVSVCSDVMAPSLSGAVATESFISQWELVDETGNPPNEANLSQLSRAKRHRLVLARLAAGKIITMSLEA